jgi:hypothetical protein
MDNMLVDCQHCEAKVDAKVIASYDDYDEDEGMAGRYHFLSCPRCSRPFIMLQVDYGPGWDEPTRIYPPKEIGLNLNIPSSIRFAYEEARICFKSKAYTATAIMCRKTLEGIADEHNIKTHNLASALQEMKEKGIIEKKLFDWADMLRISGNEAAHGVKTTISQQDAKDILEFTNALIEYIFTFQERFTKFQERRNRVNAPAQPTASSD